MIVLPLLLGSVAPGSIIDFKFHTKADDDGAPVTLAGTPAVKVYKGNSTTTEVTTGVTLTVDFDAITGLHNVRIDTGADTTFYAPGSSFNVVLTAGTVDAVSEVGTVLAYFTIAQTLAYTAGAVLTSASNGRLSFLTNLTSTVHDLHRDSILIMTSGTYVGAHTIVRRYNETTKILYFKSSLPGTPANGDTFVLVNT